MNMKRVTIIFAVVTVLLLADGLWMQLTHYHPDDQNSFFGNGNIVLSDGQVLSHLRRVLCSWPPW